MTQNEKLGVAEELIKGVVKTLDLDPQQFFVVINNVCCHGEPWKTTFEQDDTDKCLQDICKGIEDSTKAAKRIVKMTS